MEKHIYDEKTGLSYTLCGDYYLPDLVLNAYGTSQRPALRSKTAEMRS